MLTLDLMRLLPDPQMAGGSLDLPCASKAEGRGSKQRFSSNEALPLYLIWLSHIPNIALSPLIGWED